MLFSTGIFEASFQIPVLLSKEQETKIDATDGGTVFENYEVATDDNEVAIDNNSVGTSTIGLEGVSSDPDDF